MVIGMNVFFARAPLLLVLFALLGCASSGAPTVPLPPGSAAGSATPESDSFSPERLFKTDIDTATEINQRYALKEMRKLMIKLYKRNPAQWRRHAPSLNEAVDMVFAADGYLTVFPEFADHWGGDVVNFAFDQQYEGDRVRAFVVGLLQMFMKSYGDSTHFYLTSDLDPQSLYNCARNFERAAWLLNNKKRPNGRPWLIANSMDDGAINLSVERIFGKLIATQDNMAYIIAEEENRTIKTVFQSVLSVFLPV